MAHASEGAYAKGKSLEHAHETHHHTMPIKTYLQVFGALLGLTALTYVVSDLDLGSAALPVAMVVAFIKAALVVGYFMHLKFDTRFHAFVFFSTLLFVAIFFVITFFDIKTRGLMNSVWDNKVAAHDQGLLEQPETETRPLDPAKLEEWKKNPPVLHHGHGEEGEHGAAAGEHGAAGEQGAKPSDHAPAAENAAPGGNAPGNSDKKPEGDHQ